MRSINKSIDQRKYLMHMPKLMNTYSGKLLSANLIKSIVENPAYLDPLKVYYPITDVPEIFDPRFQDKIPEKDAKYWFYNIEGKYYPILSDSLQQASCGSCYAFACSTIFTDRIRLRLIKTYGSSICGKSPFFSHIAVCAGDIGHEFNGGVVSVTNDANGLETDDHISPYYTVAFCPKPRDMTIQCATNPSIESCANQTCIDALNMKIKNPGTNPLDKEHLKDQYTMCLGCDGNFIPFPLLLFCGDGAARVRDFTIYDWACLFGAPAVEKKFCQDSFFSGQNFLKYKADKYTYASKLTTSNGTELSESKSGFENQIMCEIYNYGPVASSFTVYESFMQFFSDPNNASKIYTRDIAETNTKVNGEHAIAITGWGVENNVKYWVIRNSWGEQWGDMGYFKMERGIELCGIEDDFGTIYFNPDGVDSNSVVNDMSTFLLASEDCYPPNPLRELEYDKQCKKMLMPDLCMHGTHFDIKKQKCVQNSFIRRVPIMFKNRLVCVVGWAILFYIIYKYIVKKK